jgi:hypothetical protein
MQEDVQRNARDKFLAIFRHFRGKAVETKKTALSSRFVLRLYEYDAPPTGVTAKSASCLLCRCVEAALEGPACGASLRAGEEQGGARVKYTAEHKKGVSIISETAATICTAGVLVRCNDR